MTSSAKKIVLIGASSAIAEECARLWANQKPREIVLVGRNLARLESIANDLQVRSPTSLITMLEADFKDPRKIETVVDQTYEKGSVDIVLIAHGTLPDQKECQQNLTEAQDAMEINGLSPVLFAEAFIGHMEKAEKGTLGLIGSVAGDRGRKSNYVYGAAKGLVTRYAQGLQHRLGRESPVRVCLIKPGPTDTPMTAHLKWQGASLASVASVAKTIVDGMASGKAEIYAPKKWVLIMLIIRHLPRFVFNRMDI